MEGAGQGHARALGDGRHATKPAADGGSVGARRRAGRGGAASGFDGQGRHPAVGVLQAVEQEGQLQTHAVLAGLLLE